MTQTPAAPPHTIRHCAWVDGLDSTDGTPLVRCQAEAVATLAFWLRSQKSDAPDFRSTRNSCLAHIGPWILRYWDRLAAEGSFRVRQTREYQAKLGLTRRSA